MIKKMKNIIKSNADANGDDIFSSLKRIMTPGDEVKLPVTTHIGKQDFDNLAESLKGARPDTVPERQWLDMQDTVNNKSTFNKETGVYDITRDADFLEKTSAYLNHEDYGSIRKTAIGAGIGAAALGGMAIDRSDNQGGFGGAILGSGTAVGGMTLGLSHMAKKL